MERQVGKAQGIARVLLTPPFRCFWRVTTEGVENIPGEGSAILAPNHISVLDSFFVPLSLPRRITYVGKAEYMDDWKTRFLFPAMGMIPIDRSGGDGAQRALDAAAEVLEAGELFGIYPEGTRSRNGVLHRGHTGIARLALRTGSSIIPVGIIGSDSVQPPDAKLPAPFRRVHIRFGRPIDVARYADRADDRMVLRQITDEVMFEIRNLSGQDYVDTYATRSAEPAERPESEPVAEPAAASGTPAASDGELGDNVIEFPDRRRQPDRPAASLAPSAALPTPERAVAMAVVGSEFADADGVERRSSAAVLQPRPLVGA